MKLFNSIDHCNYELFQKKEPLRNTLKKNSQFKTTIFNICCSYLFILVNIF